MLISGFTFVRNIEKYHYPVKESILSILPICDEFIVNVCDSDDNTLDIIRSISSEKIKIIKSSWNEDNIKDGSMLSEQTNVALNACKGAWCFYLQADEVVHEKDLQIIRQACEQYLSKAHIQGLLFNYHHFYGSYNIIATARNWYRKEVRIVRNHIGVYSVGDAQGFRVNNGKPRVAQLRAAIFHYGWVRHPSAMAIKNKHFFRLWHGRKFDNKFNDFQYEQHYGLKYFRDTHPLIMSDRIKAQDWKFTINKKNISWLSIKNIRFLLSDIIEKFTGKRLGEHKNYIEISDKLL